MKKTFLVISLLIMILLFTGCTFAGAGTTTQLPGLLMGFWHGLIAPWSLIVRLFADVQMYATQNTGWFYDFGFLVGVGLSLPIGWIAAIISLLYLL
jgi:hypothetical protein